MDTKCSVLKSWANILLIGLINVLMAMYFLTPQYMEWAKHEIFCVPNVKNEKSLTPLFPNLYYIASYLKLL